MGDMLPVRLGHSLSWSIYASGTSTAKTLKSKGYAPVNGLKIYYEIHGEGKPFISPGQGGTLATLLEYKPYEIILARHIAIINPDGTEDRGSATAKSWIGMTESYAFTERGGKTTVTIVIQTTPEWENRLRDGWPTALASLKKICER